MRQHVLHRRDTPRIHAGWRALIVVAVIGLGLLNPLLCVLHCLLTTHEATTDDTRSLGVAFYCILPLHPFTPEATPHEGFFGASPRAAATPFGSTDGALLLTAAIIPVLLLLLWGIACSDPAMRARAIAPIVPPPRSH